MIFSAPAFANNIGIAYCENLKIIRPRKGILPIYFNKLINKKSPQNIQKGEPIKKQILKSLKIKKIL